MKKTILSLFLCVTTLSSFAQCYEAFQVGGGHFVGRKSNGTIWGWGYGIPGSLCTNIQNTTTQIQLCNASDWNKVFTGIYATYGIKNNGTLWATGWNGWDGNAVMGLLGINSTVSNIYTFTQVGTATDWVKVSGSSNFTLGLKSNGTLWGWGQNDTAQLGIGFGANVLAPIQVGTATDWADIKATDIGTGLAIKTNGTLWGWGFNGSGMTGAPSNVQPQTTPAQIGTATDWLNAKLEAGVAHALVLKTNGTLWAWGDNQTGQTADNLPSTVFRRVPLQIGTDTWKAIGAGWRASYGIKTNGTLWAWGENQNGCLGLGNSVNQYVPAQVGTATDWASVHVTTVGGVQTTIATKTDGTVWGWGDNSEGQLGNGTYVNQPLPVLLPNHCVTPLANENFELNSNSITLAPNPTNNVVYLKYELGEENALVSIYDISGRLMQNKTLPNTKGEIALDTSSYESGMYIVVVKQNDKIISQQKLIKE